MSLQETLTLSGNPPLSAPSGTARVMVADDKGNEWVKVDVQEVGGQVSISDKKGQKHVLTATPPKPAEK